MSNVFRRGGWAVVGERVTLSFSVTALQAAHAATCGATYLLTDRRTLSVSHSHSRLPIILKILFT